jgi:hypothetical protein
MCGQGLLLIGRPACSATSAYRLPLPRFPLRWSAKAAGRWARMWYMHDGVPAHFSRVVRVVVSNTYHNRWIGRGGPTASPLRWPDLNPLDFYLWGHLKTFVYAAPVDNEEALRHRIVDAWQTICKLPRHLRADAAVLAETCRDVRWISWRTFWALIINVLFDL